MWFELLNRMIEDKSFDIMFAEFNDANNNIFRKNMNILKDKIVKRYKSKHLFWKRYFDIRLPKNPQPFIFHSSYYRLCKNKEAINITTVHDFTLEYYGRFIEKRLHCWQKYKAIRNSDYIICISQNTKQDLLKFLPQIDESKIGVVYHGVSQEYFIIDKSQKHNLPFEAESYVIYVGARYHYKNFDFTVEAVAKSDKNFVIVGYELSKKEINFLNDKLGKERYKYLGRVDNKYLNVLYNNAYCLMYLSSYEGFGIPILEAQKSGCPVIAVEGSSVLEIIGDKTLLIKRLEIEAVLEKLKILSNSEIRANIISLGLENSSKFQWEKMYNQIKNIYLNLNRAHQKR